MNAPTLSGDHYQVDRAGIREFAHAIKNFHPAHWDEDTAHRLGYPGIIAPATYASSINAVSQGRLFRTATTNFAPSQLLHLEQEIHSHRPIVAGDLLSCEVGVDSHRRTAAGDLLVLTTVISERDAGPVQTVHTTLFGRHGAIAEAASTLAAQHLPVSPELLLPDGELTPGHHRAAPCRLGVGDQLPPRTYQLSRTQLIEYARVSGDHNPIHWNDTVAHAAGLDNVVAHGMLTMGLGADYLTTHLDPPTSITEYSVQFSRPVYVPPSGHTSIEFNGTVRTVDGSATVIALTAHSGGEPIFARATATVRPT